MPTNAVRASATALPKIYPVRDLDEAPSGATRQSTRRGALAIAFGALSGLALAPANAAPSPDAIDAELLALLGRWLAAQDESDEIQARWSAFDKAFPWAPWPDAAKRRADDCWFPWDRGQRLEYHREWLEETRPHIDRIRALDGNPVCTRMAARFDEIDRAVGAWELGERQRGAGGLDAIEREADRILAIIVDLGMRIAQTPARTASGMIAKLSALARVADGLLEGDMREHIRDGWHIGAVLHSVAIDCARLDEAGASRA